MNAADCYVRPALLDHLTIIADRSSLKNLSVRDFFYQDSRFNPEIDQKTKYRTRSILCMPIKDSNDEVIGVAQAINKRSMIDEPFNEHDEKVCCVVILSVCFASA
jgi:GAF domain